MPDIISVIIALVLVIVAAVHDLREFRIPNRLIVAGIVVRIDANITGITPAELSFIGKKLFWAP